MKYIVTLFTFIFLSNLFLNVPQTAAAQEDSSEVISIVSDGAVNAIEYNEKILYIGGKFTTLTLDNGQPLKQSNFARVDIPTRQLTGNQLSINNSVEDILLKEEKVYMAGTFTQINDQPISYFTVLDSETGSIISNSISPGGPIYSLASHENELFSAGNYHQINDVERSNISSYDEANKQLTSWAPEVNDTVYSVQIIGDRIYIGGAFTAIGEMPRQHIAAFDLASKELLAWTPQVDTVVRSIQKTDDKLTVSGVETNEKNQTTQRTYTIDPETANVVVIGQQIIDATPLPTISVSLLSSSPSEATVEGLMVDSNVLGFKIPSLSDILTFAIRGFFAVAGIAALFYMLVGAFGWITSGGDKDAITAAREKIQSAVVGLLLMVAVLSIIWTLEQVIFKRRICLGLSCSITLPSLLEPTP